MIRNNPVAQYIVVTIGYWTFTLTDGALRMLLVLFFHDQGFSPLEIAMLFVLYELFGVITNLFGGWVATRIGLNMTMHAGLVLQILALAMLLADPSMLTVVYVMITQALSGIAKDLNKMSAKSSIRMLVRDADGALYRWVARLTGSKNAMKGAGFFLGGALLAAFGFRGALWIMGAALIVVLVLSLFLLERDLGTASFRPAFRELLSKSPAINRLSAARFFLFSSRDVWFVVALPVFLQTQMGWSHMSVGSLMAVWVVGYGVIQALAPRITGAYPDGRTAWLWAAVLSVLTAGLALVVLAGWQVQILLIAGLLAFGAVFAINSSVHSYLIVSYAREDGVSLDVGFYYMANAAGRLGGTVLSGIVYQTLGLAACLLLSAAFLAASSLLAVRLPREERGELKAGGA